MKHSNRNKKEQGYKKKLSQEQSELRELRKYKKDLENFHEERVDDAKKKAGKNIRRTYCACMFFVLLIIALGIIVYFYWQIKDVVREEFIKQKQDLPANIEQIEQGIEKTEQTISEAKAKYDQAKAFYEEAQATYEKVKNMTDATQEKINQAQNTVNNAKSVFEKAENTYNQLKP